jgi:hypothetical protein
MATIYTPTNWVNEVPGTSPIKYKVTDDSAGIVAASAKIEQLTSVTPGTPLNATNLNHMETGIKNAQDAANAAQDSANAAIPKSIVTAAGDLIFATGSGALARLGKGNNGSSLTVLAGQPAWSGGAIGGLLGNGTAVSIANSVTTYINSFGSSYDNGVFAGVGRLTVPAGLTGIYLISAEGYWEVNQYYQRQMGIRINGNSSLIFWNTQPGMSPTQTWHQFIKPYYLSAGDYVELLVLQNSGSSLNFYPVDFGIFLLH